MKFITCFPRFTRSQSANLLILLAAFLCVGANAAAQITLINVTNCGPTSFPLACTIPSTGSGHLLVIGFEGESNAAISSITDNVGDTYAEAGGAEASLKVRHGNWTSDIWYAANSKAGATSITVNITPLGSQGAVVVWEFSGVSTVSPLDQVAEVSNQKRSSTPQGAPVTTSNASDVIISLALVTNDITGIYSGNPFTEDSSLWYDGWAHLITSSAGTYAAQWNQNPSGSYGSSTASFKASGGAPPTYLLSASPTSLNFGNVTVGTQSVLPIILTNIGTGAVTMTQDTITGAGFGGSGLSLPFTLSSGQNTDLSVTFAPAAAGSVTGSASVVSNASGSPTIVSLSGAGVNSHYVDLSWTASTSSGVTGYDIYRSTTSGGPYTQLNTSLIAGTSYTDSSVVAGQTYYYVTTAVNSGGVQSGYSTPASATVPSP